MTITVNLVPEMEARLRDKAAREGHPAEAVAQVLLVQAIQSDVQTPQEVLLKDYGISQAQAADLRASLASFAEEWDRPEMDVYDDYDAARAMLKAKS